jgi:DNA-binding NarL/FixJ family response regulator
MPPPRKPGIALLSDHVTFRQLVAQRLADQGHGPVVQVASKDKLIAAAKRKRVDIAIIDIDHDSDDTMTLVRALHAELPGLSVIVLATPVEATSVDSIVVETEDVDRATAISALVPALRSSDDKTPHRHWSRITERQREVMRWLAVGLDNAAIGQKLRIGERAVKAHVSSLLGLFGLENRTQLALMAHGAGLRPPARR